MSLPTMPELDFSTIGPNVGEMFPDILLPDQDGILTDLHRARDGHPALVVFYRSASW